MIFGVEVGQEIDIRVESYSDPMDEQDWKSRLRGVRPIPVSEGFRRGPMGGEESEEPWWEDGEEPEKRRAVKAEGVVAQINRCCRVDDKHTP